ncbi:hypothetical protein [Nitrosotalea sinensis]|uniref:hypothetical protein n=1 Tax=Nitrosotalea sinensis TaxID=1499975 RepID=UPI000C306DD1|nr:hypothetical protein [Candidatus Nitrosotalea sinensis]
MGTKRIIIGSIILAIGALAWLRMWYGENGVLSNPTNATQVTARSYTALSDPNTFLVIGVIAVVIAIGSVILASGIRSSLSQN